MSARRDNRHLHPRGGEVQDAAGLIGWDGEADGSPPRLQVAEIQRKRLLAAAVSTVDEFGYADVTVSHITARSRVSRRTFYDLFENREDCLAAVLEDALDRIRREIADAGLDSLSWRERVRGGLWAILSFFDREPALARMCVVQAARGSERLLVRRADVLTTLAGIIDEGRSEGSRSVDVPRLTAEGLVGAAHAIVYERLLKRRREPLTGLLAPLMGMIVLPYRGPAAARREQSRPTPSPPKRPAVGDAQEMVTAERDPLQGLPIRMTYRTARVLRAVGESPGISNRAVGDRAGATDQGQISKLLARLERLGLMTNTGEGHAKGEANAWRLTLMGQQVTQHLYTSNREEAA